MKEERNYTVYKHSSPSGKVYIGITSNDPERRWQNGNGYKKQIFYNAIQKYGWDNIKHEIIANSLTKEEAEQMEIELIKKYKSDNCKYGYNVEKGGNTTGTHSEETKKKISMANKGKKRSEEHCRHMSIIRKGKFLGKDNPNYWKHMSEEQKRKISETRLRKGIKRGVVTEETRKKT